jgi:hypothetical protein
MGLITILQTIQIITVSGTYGNNSSSNNNNNSYSNYRQNNSNNNRSKIGTYRVANYDPDKLNEPSLSRTQQYK